MNYIHGGNIYKYKKEVIDFSSNINPLGMPDNLIKDINESIEDIINYPDPDYIKLRKRIAFNYNVDYKDIVVGNGGIQLIHNAIEFINGKSILIVSPSFVEYAKASKRFNKEVKYYLLLEKNDFKLNVDEFLKFDFNNVDNVMICNPN
ncbi:aminotransferase class I/II-fold pyridoxal phosphate-dependent enzyme, partial [Clostridiaceae bacterium HSG29]|nr:aminotransferase class I/II-fold pyridoxal phosphate-dependent enzyme [Clostridiaceae bacterium HSG29]